MEENDKLDKKSNINFGILLAYLSFLCLSIYSLHVSLNKKTNEEFKFYKKLTISQKLRYFSKNIIIGIIFIIIIMFLHTKDENKKTSDQKDLKNLFHTIIDTQSNINNNINFIKKSQINKYTFENLNNINHEILNNVNKKILDEINYIKKKQNFIVDKLYDQQQETDSESFNENTKTNIRANNEQKKTSVSYPTNMILGQSLYSATALPSKNGANKTNADEGLEEMDSEEFISDNDDDIEITINTKSLKNKSPIVKAIDNPKRTDILKHKKLKHKKIESYLSQKSSNGNKLLNVLKDRLGKNVKVLNAKDELQ